MGVMWEVLVPNMHIDQIGLLPFMLSDTNPKPAREQLDCHYQHGGGWRPFEGFELRTDNSIKYPGDSALHPIARAKLRDELIFLYEYAWVAIVQLDRSYEVCRMD